MQIKITILNAEVIFSSELKDIMKPRLIANTMLDLVHNSHGGGIMSNVNVSHKKTILHVIIKMFCYIVGHFCTSLPNAFQKKKSKIGKGSPASKVTCSPGE